MTVSSQTNNEFYVRNGVSTTYPLPFRFFKNSDIHVYNIDPDTGASSPLTLGVDYTLSGAGEPEINGSAVGVLTTTVPGTAGVGLYVERILPLQQLIDLINQGLFFPEVHEEAFDYLTMLTQQASASAFGAIRVPIGEPDPPRLAPAPERAGKFLAFDDDGNPITVIPNGSDGELETRLRDEIDPENGVNILGYRGRTQRDVNNEVIRVADYYYLAATPYDAALLAIAAGQGRTVELLDDVANGGPLILGGNVPVPHPCHIKGAGKGRTTVIFQGMGGFAGTDGFSIQEGAGRLMESAITDMTIVIRGNHGRTCISTPRGNTVYNLNRPTYRFENLVFRGDVMNVDANKQDLYDYGWQTYIDVGDSVGTVIKQCEGYGFYDWTQDPAGQNVTAQWVNLSTVQNVGGLLQARIEDFLTVHIPIGIQLGWRVSQCIVRSGQVHRAWIPLYSPNASLGGNNYSVLEALFSDLNLNGQRNGLVFATSAFLKFDSVRCSRASGGFDHADGWTGWVLDGITQLAIYGQGRASNLGTYTATHEGHRLLNCSQAFMDGLIAENCTNGIYLLNSDKLAVGDATLNNCTFGFRYDGTFNDTVIRHPRFNTVTTPHVFEVGVNRGEILILPVDGSRFPGVDGAVTGISTSATTTLTPYVDNWIKRYQGNSGTYTHNIDLVSGISGRPETWEFKIDTVAGATGGAIVLRRASDSSTIVSLATNGTVQRFYVKVYWNGTNWILLTANVSLA